MWMDVNAGYEEIAWEEVGQQIFQMILINGSVGLELRKVLPHIQIAP